MNNDRKDGIRPAGTVFFQAKTTKTYISNNLHINTEHDVTIAIAINGVQPGQPWYNKLFKAKPVQKVENKKSWCCCGKKPT